MRIQLIIGAIFVAGAAQATVLIDNYSTGIYNKTITGGSDLAFQTGSMLGGDRYSSMMVETNPFGLELQTNIQNGAYALSSQSGVNAMGELGYGFQANGAGTSFQDLNFNFSGENAFKLNFLSSDTPGTVMMSVRSSSSNGGAFSSVTKPIPGNSVNTPFMTSFSFSEFAGINFSDVDQLVIKFDTGISGDIALDSVEAVPEPATMIVLGAAAAVAARRRKRN